MADIDISVNTSELKKATESIKNFADEIRNMDKATKRASFENFFNTSIRKGNLNQLTKYLISDGFEGITPQLKKLISSGSPILGRAFALDSKGNYKQNSVYFAGLRREFIENLYSRGFQPSPKKDDLRKYLKNIPQTQIKPVQPKIPETQRGIMRFFSPSFLTKFTLIGTALYAALSTLKTVIRSFSEIIKSSFTSIEKTVGVAYQLRSSVSSSMQLGEMFEMAGMSVDKMKVNIYSMQQTLSRRPDYFRNIGIDVDRFKGMNSADQMIEVLGKLGGMKSAFERSGATRLIFGFRSQEMGQLIERLGEFVGRSESATSSFKQSFDTFGTTMNDVSSKIGTITRMIQNTFIVAMSGIAPKINEIADNIIGSGDILANQGKRFAIILSNLFGGLSSSFKNVIDFFKSPAIKGIVLVFSFLVDLVVNGLQLISDAIVFLLKTITLGLFGNPFDSDKYWLTRTAKSGKGAFGFTDAVSTAFFNDDDVIDYRYDQLKNKGKLSEANPEQLSNENSLQSEVQNYSPDEQQNTNYSAMKFSEILKSAYQNVGGYASSASMNVNAVRLSQIETQIKTEQAIASSVKNIEGSIKDFFAKYKDKHGIIHYRKNQALYQ